MTIEQIARPTEAERLPSWKSVPTQRVLLQGVSWETYERLLNEHQANSSTHFTYDQGTLEIMVLSLRHETLKHLLALLVDIFAEEAELDTVAAGSTTFRRADLARGFEPDACFYFAQEALVRGKEQLDLEIDPSPELVIEIDITSPSLNKFPIYAALQIAELWRFDGERVTIWGRQDDGYIELLSSRIFTPVTGPILTEFLESGQSVKRTSWLRQVRSWAQAQLGRHSA